MKHFTIENETNNIMVHASAEAAGAVPNADSFNSEKGLANIAADWPAARLIEIWNSLPGVTPVSKFKDRATAAGRIWKAVQGLGTAEPEPEPEENQSEATEPVADRTAPEAEATAQYTATDVAPQAAHVAPQKETASDMAIPDTAAPVAAAPVHIELCRELLGIAARAQTAFWDALRNLEKTIGFELGEPGDLNEATIENLLAQDEARRKPRAASRSTRDNSKTAQVIEMLKREGGATLEEIMSAMAWQKHTTRAMLSAGGSLTKNHGLLITSAKVGDKRVYSIKA